MLFITAQDLPSKEYQDNKGEFHKEVCTFNEITVPVNPSLGFKPMWAIPITTFKETLTSMLLTAPNYPCLFCVFDTDEYVKIDKIHYYKNIMNGTKEIPIASDELPTYKSEFCLNLEKVGNPIFISPIYDFLDIYHRKNDINILFPTFGEFKLPAEMCKVLMKNIDKLSLLDVESTRKNFESMNFHNIDYRVSLNSSWYLYRLSILPFLLYSHFKFSDSENLFLRGLNVLGVGSILYCYRNLNNILNQFAKWSYNDCSEENFDYYYRKIFDSIIDDEKVLEPIVFDSLKSKDKCPCESGKKFKNCHGKGLKL